MAASRPLKSLGSGALQELITSEEDYLAYRAAIHLSQMSVDDLSALTLNIGGNLVGNYENTVYTGSGTTGVQTYTRSVVALHSSDGISSHTSVITEEGYFPGTVFVNDLLVFQVTSNTSHTGSGFDSILHELSSSGTATFRVVSVVSSPFTTIDNLDVEWSGGSLTSTYTTTFTLEVETEGSFEFSLIVASVDGSNSTVTTFDNVIYPTITVQAEGPPLFTSFEYDLYQNTEAVGTFVPNDVNKKNPIFWDRTLNAIKEMDNDELDELCERLLKKIMADELPGTFRLATTGEPNELGEDWEVFILNAFSDTRYDGVVVNYSIFIRKTYTEPTPKVKPMRIKRLAGAFAGLEPMTDAEMEFTFGERAKKVMMDSGIGTYQLRSAAQGAPTDAGTWIARGSALDTRLSYEYDPGYTAEVIYGPGEIATYGPIYSTDYIDAEYPGEYTGTYSSDFETGYAPDYETPYTGNFTAIYEGNFSGDYITTYSGEYQDSYIGTYQGEFVGDYTPSYDAAGYDAQYEDLYTGATYESNYNMVFELSQYELDVLYETDYEGIDYQGEFLSNYGNVPYNATIYAGANYAGNYQTSFGIEYSGDYGLAGQYSTDYNLDYTGEYNEPYSQNYTGDVVNTYTGNYIDFYNLDYETGYDTLYSTDYTGDYGITAYYETQYIQGEYTPLYNTTYQVFFEGNYDLTYVPDYEQDFYSTGYTDNYLTDYSGTYEVQFVGDYDLGYTSLSDVAFDASSESHTTNTLSTSESSFSWTHTPVSTPRGILVYVFSVDSTGWNGSVSVTYGGTSLTAVSSGYAQDTVGEVGATQAFFLGSGIPTGAQTVVVTRPNDVYRYYAVCASVTAARDTEVTGVLIDQENQTFTERNVDDGSIGINSLRFCGAYSGRENMSSFVGPNSTLVHSVDNPDPSGLRSAGLIRETTPGQGSRPVGFGAGITDDLAAVYLAIRETSSAYATTYQETYTGEYANLYTSNFVGDYEANETGYIPTGASLIQSKSLYFNAGGANDVTSLTPNFPVGEGNLLVVTVGYGRSTPGLTLSSTPSLTWNSIPEVSDPTHSFPSSVRVFYAVATSTTTITMTTGNRGSSTDTGMDFFEISTAGLEVAIDNIVSRTTFSHPGLSSFILNTRYDNEIIIAAIIDEANGAQAAILSVDGESVTNDLIAINHSSTTSVLIDAGSAGDKTLQWGGTIASASAQRYATVALGFYFVGGAYEQAYTGDYLGNAYSRDYATYNRGDFTGDYVSDYLRDVYTDEYVITEVQYIGTTIETYNLTYTTDFEGSYILDYEGSYGTDYSGNYISDYTGNFEGTYDAGYETQYVEQAYTLDYGPSYIPTYDRSYLLEYSGGYGDGGNEYIPQIGYGTNFEGNYIGAYEEDYIIGAEYIGAEYNPQQWYGGVTYVSGTIYGDEIYTAQDTYIGAGGYIGNYGTAFGSPITVSYNTDLSNYTGPDVGFSGAIYTGPQDFYEGTYISYLSFENTYDNYVLSLNYLSREYQTAFDQSGNYTGPALGGYNITYLDTKEYVASLSNYAGYDQLYVQNYEIYIGGGNLPTSGVYGEITYITTYSLNEYAATVETTYVTTAVLQYTGSTPINYTDSEYLINYSSFEDILATYLVGEYILSYDVDDEVNYSDYVRSFQGDYIPSYSGGPIEFFYITVSYTPDDIYQNVTIGGTLEYLRSPPDYNNYLITAYVRNEYLGPGGVGYQDNRVFVGEYTPNYNVDYEGNAFERTFSGDYQVTYTQTYDLSYTTEYDDFYQAEYGVTYIDDYVGEYDETVYTATFTIEYLLEYDVTQVETYSEDYEESLYTGDYLLDYTGNDLGDYISIYTGDYDIVPYTGNYIDNYSGDYVSFQPETYTGDYDVIAYLNDYLLDYTGDYLSIFDSLYTGDYEALSYTGDYDGITYTGDYDQLTYTGDILEQYTSEYNSALYANDYGEDYTGPGYDGTFYSGDYNNTLYEGDYDGIVYTGDFTINYDGDYGLLTYQLDYAGQDYTGDYDIIDYIEQYDRSAYQINYEIIPYDTVVNNPYTGEYIDFYATDYDTNPYTGNYSGLNYLPEDPYTGNYIDLYIEVYEELYTGEYGIATYSQVIPYTGEYTIGSYIPELPYTGEYNIGTYSQVIPYTGEYNIGTYSQVVPYTGEYNIGTYSQVVPYTGEYNIGTYSQVVPYTGEYNIGSYSLPVPYTGDYEDPYTGNYIGTNYDRLTTVDYQGSTYGGEYSGTFYDRDTATNFEAIAYSGDYDGTIYTGTYTGGTYVSDTDYVGTALENFDTTNYNVDYAGTESTVNFTATFTSDSAYSFSVTVGSNFPSADIEDKGYVSGYIGSISGNYITNIGTITAVYNVIAGAMTGQFSYLYLAGISNSTLWTSLTIGASTYNRVDATWTGTEWRWPGGDPFRLSYSVNDVVSCSLNMAAATDYDGTIYTGNYLPNFVEDYLGTYVGNYDSLFAADYIGDPQENYTVTPLEPYTGDYTGNFTGNYERDVLENYIGNYTGDFTGDYAQAVLESYIGGALEGYTGNYGAGYSGDAAEGYTGNYGAGYSGDAAEGYTGNYGAGYSGDAAEGYTGNYGAGYSGDAAEGYTGNYGAGYSGDSTEGYTGSYGPGYTGDSTEGYTGNYGVGYAGGGTETYQRDYSQDYTGDALENFVGTYGVGYTQDGLDIYTETYADSYTGDSQELYAGDFSVSYTGDSVVDYVDTYEQTYTGTTPEVYALEYIELYTGNAVEPYIADATAAYTQTYATAYEESYLQEYDGTVNYQPDYNVLYTTEYEATTLITYTGNYTEDYTGSTPVPYTGTYDVVYTGTGIENYTGDYDSAYDEIYESNYSIPYTGTYGGDYLGVYAGNYVDDYTGDYVEDFIGEYLIGIPYTGNYQDFYEANFEANYVEDYGSTYAVDYSGDYSTTYDLNYDTDYVEDYTRTVIENYTGDYDQQYLDEYLTLYEVDYDISYNQDYDAATYIGTYDGTLYTGNYDTEYQSAPLFEGSTYSGVSSFYATYDGSTEVDYVNSNFTEIYSVAYTGGSGLMYTGAVVPETGELEYITGASTLTYDNILTFVIGGGLSPFAGVFPYFTVQIVQYSESGTFSSASDVLIDDITPCILLNEEISPDGKTKAMNLYWTASILPNTTADTVYVRINVDTSLTTTHVQIDYWYLRLFGSGNEGIFPTPEIPLWLSYFKFYDNVESGTLVDISSENILYNEPDGIEFVSIIMNKYANENFILETTIPSAALAIGKSSESSFNDLTISSNLFSGYKNNSTFGFVANDFITRGLINILSINPIYYNNVISFNTVYAQEFGVAANYISSDYDTLILENYSVYYESGYTDPYTGTYAAEDYIGSSFESAPFAATTYTGNYASYDDEYLNEYGSTFSVPYSADFESDYNVQYSGFYSTEYTGIQTQNYNLEYSSEYVPTYSDDYSSDYDGNVQIIYTGDYEIDYIPTFVGEYDSIFDVDYQMDFETDYGADYLATYSRDPATYTSESLVDYEIDYAAQYGNLEYNTNYTGILTYDTYDTLETMYVEGIYTDTYQDIYESPYDVNYQTDYLSDYIEIVPTDYQQDLYTGDYDSIYLLEYTTIYNIEYLGDYGTDYVGDYISDYTGSYEETYLGAYSGDFLFPYIPNYSTDYIIQLYYIADYDTDYSGNYTPFYATDYATDFTDTYDGTDAQEFYNSSYSDTNYDTQYTGEYSGTNYSAESLVNYTGPDITIQYDTIYEGDEYLTNYTSDYDGTVEVETYVLNEYSTDYDDSYEHVTAYAADVTYGEGTKLTGVPTIIETYTLYVRVA